MRGFESLDSGQ